MIEIVTPQQARSVSQLEFCYVCGKPFTENAPSTRDHVPPKKIFLSEDRNWPLILPAHRNCNSEYSFSDEQAKGLLYLLHLGPTDQPEPPFKTELAGVVERDGQPVGVLLEGLNLRTIVAKILRACHAALYGEFLKNEETNQAILLPLPIFDLQTGGPDKNEHLPQHEVLCNILKDNRRIGNVDRIESYNGKFRFEAVWTSTDDQQANAGVFAIDIYGWHNLASQVAGRAQGCFGMYRLGAAPIPAGASVATSIELPYHYKQPANPFEDT